MKKIVSLIVVLLCVVGLFACSKKSAVIGTWTDMDGYNTMEFNEKTGRMISGSQEVGFNYTINDKTISADMGFMVDVMDYNLSKVDGVDCLKMKINGENFTFYRKDDIAKIKTITQTTETTKIKNAKQNDTRFVGTWGNEKYGDKYEFYDEKNGKYISVPDDYKGDNINDLIFDFTYEYDDKNITFNYTKIPTNTCTYKIENGKLHLYVNGEEFLFTKQ